MKPSTLALCLLLIPMVATAQDAAFIEAMDAAMADHSPSPSDLEKEHKVIEKLQALSEQYPDKWQPDLQISFYLTQIARSIRYNDTENYVEAGGKMLDQSKVHLDRAIARAKKDPTADLADFYALETLLYEEKSRVAQAAGDRETYDADRTKGIDAHRKALEKNPNSPVLLLYVARAFAIEGQEERGKNLYKLMAAQALFENATEQCDQAEALSMTSYFNCEYLDNWNPWVEEQVQKVKADEETVLSTGTGE